MRAVPPVLPGSSYSAESPVDRALSLALAQEPDAALRWAAALVKHDPSMPTALCLCARLLGDLGRHELARETCTVAVERALDFENLPLAVAAARECERFGGSIGELLDGIAAAYCKGSPRLGDGSPPPPPPLPSVDDFHPLPSVLTGASLLNKATEIVHEASAKLANEKERPKIRPLRPFSALSQSGLREFCAVLDARWIPQGSTVIEQGAEGREAYFVARGELEARRTRNDESIVLAKLTNGSIFGEMALLARAPRSASVVSTRPSIVMKMAREDLDRVNRSQPEVGAEFARHCRERMVQNLVKTSPVLASVPLEDRTVLAKQFQAKIFDKNSALVTQNQVPDGVYFIASGEVSIVNRDGSESLILTSLGTGDVVGEVATILRRKAAADVIAIQPTITLFLSTNDLLNLAKKHSPVFTELYLLAIKRDEETASLMEVEADIADEAVII